MGITDLPTLLRTMTPTLSAESYAFVLVPTESAAKALRPVGLFREAEGITVICRADLAETNGHPGAARFRQITLQVHSSLQSVGLIAAVSTALASRGIACNVVSAFCHDHVFVPEADAEQALAELRALSQAAARAT